MLAETTYLCYDSNYDRSRLLTEHATRAQAAKKVLDASNHIPTSNPEPTYIPDRQIMSDESKIAQRGEGYSYNLFEKIV